MAFLPAKYRKYGGAKIDLDMIEIIEDRYDGAGFSSPKYLQYIKMALEKNYKVSLYDAQTTVSKYVTVKKGKRTFKVRFSNHKPNKTKELNNECDFFVGITHLGITNTDNAWEATKKFFNDNK